MCISDISHLSIISSTIYCFNFKVKDIQFLAYLSMFYMFKRHIKLHIKLLK